MIVYGDHPRATTLHALHALAVRRHAEARAADPGLARHAALVSTFIAWAELTRAAADADFTAHGRDRTTPDGDALMAMLVRLARAVGISWRGRLRRTPVPCLAPAPLDRAVETKPAEGFAFYALYPEAVFEAAARLGPGRDRLIVGLRGIGTALAAMAAAALRPRAAPITLRPVGHPFDRRIAADLPPPAVRALAVDEGPGLSGSSFAAAVDWLEQGGTPAGRITLLPSHPNPPGAMASARVRALWSACTRVSANFDSSILPRLPEWVTEVLGEPVTLWEPMPGGTWPTDPARERRKYRATTAHGVYLVKFAGLGEIGTAKLARARELAAEALVPEPVGLAHGFLVERWVSDGPPAAPTAPETARYLAARSRLAPPNSGAPLSALIAMARANIAEALGADASAAFAARTTGGDALVWRPVATDNRLHAWEWLRDADGRLLKADALDHCEGHDLVGCQDIAWDIAGAAIELGIDPVALTAALDADPRLVALHGLLYSAFQLGLWTMARHPRAGVYASELRCLLTPAEPPRAAAGH